MGPDIVPEAAAASARMGGLLRDSTLYFIGNLSFKAIGFVMIPFYAHFLSPEQSGVLNLIELAMQVVAIAFGLQTVGAALTRIYHDQSTEAGRRETISTAMLCTILLAGFIAVVSIAFADPIARAINVEGQTGLLRLAFGAMFFSSIVEIALVHERMQSRARFYLAYTIVGLVATLSLNIALIGVIHLGVLGFIVSKLVVAVAGCVYLLGRIWREVGIVWRGAIARALAVFGAPLIVSGMSYFAVHFSDRLFLAHISKADVGVYSMAYNFAFLLSVLIGDSFSKSWGVSFLRTRDRRRLAETVRHHRTVADLRARHGLDRDIAVRARYPHPDGAAKLLPADVHAAGAGVRIFSARGGRLLQQHAVDRHRLRAGRQNRCRGRGPSTWR